jgi:hypothetical protein
MGQASVSLWTTSTHPLPAANSLAGLAAVQEQGTGGTGIWRLAIIAGLGASLFNTVYTNSMSPPSTATDLAGSWATGQGAALASGSLGTGGSLTALQGGQQNATFVYGGFGSAATVAGFSDGDQVQVQVYFTDNVGGDQSPIGAVSFKVGQPPTLSAIAPAGTITNGQPTASFSYSAGAGGGSEYSWQVQVKLSSTVIFDTAVRYDSLNSILLTIAPLLVPSTSYTLVISASSQDSAYPGSSSSVTSTTTFTTSAFAVLSAPGSFVVTPSGAAGNMSLSWGAVGSASYYRIYYRLNGTSTWYLYQDNVAGTSVTAMDHLALNTSYDFAVSVVSVTPAESALSTASLANVIASPTLSPSYSAFLHVAGSGPTYNVAVQFQTIDTSSPSYKESIDVTWIKGFGQGAPVARYGPLDYRDVSAKAFLNDLTTATLQSLQSVMDQVKAGGTAFWRDSLGTMLTVAFDTQQQLGLYPPSYREGWLAMKEVLDQVGPYVSQGSAQGYRVLVNGRLPALTTSQRAL